MPTNDDQLTGYAQELKKRDKYPLKPARLWRDRKPNRERPTATCYLVLPNVPGDIGTGRPLGNEPARHSQAIEIVDVNTHTVVTTPVLGHAYTLRCHVLNRGAVGCYAGIAEFYVATPAALDAWAAGTGPRPAPLGYAGAIVPTAGQATVTCQHLWNVTDLNSGIVVCIYDPIVDRPATPYNSATDRHVARRDIVPDFSGTYTGLEHIVQTPGTGYQLKIVIQQVNNVATVSVYSQVGGGLPVVPQISGSAVVGGGSFIFNFSEQINGQPFTSNVMTFSLPNPNLLHYTQHRHFLMPGDTRPDQDMVADLPRV